MSRQDDIRKLIATYNRRLQIRKEQQALEGPSVPPNILIEIEDIEAELETLKANLAELERVEAPPAPLLPLAEAPYRGLEVFDVEHAHLFFGREQLTAKLLDRLSPARFLAVVGPSGSGKSSVVRAGLLHQIQQGALPGSAEWRTLLVTPTAQPLEALARGLRDLLPDLGPRAILKDAGNCPIPGQPRADLPGAGPVFV